MGKLKQIRGFVGEIQAKRSFVGEIENKNNFLYMKLSHVLIQGGGISAKQSTLRMHQMLWIFYKNTT